MIRLLLVSAFLSIAASAAAQSLYVAGALGADISLATGQESSAGLSFPTGGGESLSGAARLGVLLDQRWGIELEVSRAAEITDTSSFGPMPLAMTAGAARPTLLPEIEFHTRITTISTTGSIRQQVADSVALVYLGGVVFHRTDSRNEFRGLRGLPAFGDFGVARNLGALGLVMPSLPSSGIDSVRYGAGPVVGFEAHIGYGEHFMIIPGVRMHGLPASWLVRPSVGVGWTF